MPVRLAFDQMQRGAVAHVMMPDALVLMAHAVCRPFVLKATKDGTLTEANARLPRSFEAFEHEVHEARREPERHLVRDQYPCRLGGDGGV